MGLVWLTIIGISILIALSILMRFLKRTMRLLMTLSIILILVGGGIYLYKDVNNLNKNFIDKEKLFLLDIDGKIVAGFTSQGFETTKILDDVSKLNRLYQNKNFKSIKENYYKLIIFKWPAFENIQKIDDKEYTITNQEAKKALLSKNPKQLYIDKTVQLKGEQYREFIKQKADEEFSTETTFRGIVFGLFVSETGKENIMISEFKDDNIIIYPEKITFKIIKLFPQQLINKFMPIKINAGE